MLDIVLLKIMKYQVEYKRLIKTVPVSSIDPKTKALLDDFGKYFQKFPEHDKIDMQVFIPRFRQWHPGLKDDQFVAYNGMLKQVEQDVDDSTRQGILTDLYELDLGTNVANALAQYDEGTMEMPLGAVLSAYLDAYKINTHTKEIPWNDVPIEDLLQEDMHNEGMAWRLRCLNESMRPLRAGDMGIIAGRPDQGKTSFLASEVTFMAPQLPEDRNVIWLNNEGMSGRIKKRLYQAALGKTITQLVNMANEDRDQIRAEYIEAVGRIDRIRVLDIHGWHVGQVEAVLEQSNPGLVVYDMIDNIRGFGSEARTDLQLEAMYQWAREKAVKYEFVALATSQISAEGEGEMYPGLSMLKDSKTGKQGACDFQLMIGSVNKPGFEFSRFLSLPKNKLSIDGGPKDPRAQVAFKPGISRYEDAEVFAHLPEEEDAE